MANEVHQQNQHGRFEVCIPVQGVVQESGAIGTSEATLTLYGWTNRLNRSVELVAAGIVMDAAYTGANTNYRSIEVLQAAVEMAAWDGTLGNDLTADTYQALTLNATVANRVVDHNESVHVTATENGTGLGIGPGVVILEFDSPTT